MRRLAQTLLSGATCIATLAIFFRFAIISTDARFFGDRYDGVIEIALLEHWYNVWSGLANWPSPLFLFPYKNALGYNDGLFASGLIYAAFRNLTSDIYSASKYTNVIIKIVGFLGNYIFIIRVLSLSAIWATLGAAIFTLSNNSFVQGEHVQLFTLAFAPVLGTLLSETLTAIGRRRQFAAAAWSAAAATCFSVWIMTAFYMAWFFLGFAVVTTCIVFVIGGITEFRAAMYRITQCWPSVAVAIVTLILTATPFFWLYLPKISETVVHSASEMKEYLLLPADVLNLGRGSFVYDGLQRWLRPNFGSNTEHATGFTPGLLLLFFATLLSVIRKPSRGTMRISACMGLAAVGLWLASTRFGDYSLWPLIYRLVPGASAIRVVSRIQIFLAWPIVCVAMVGLASWSSWLPHRRLALGLASTLGLFICVEQFNTWRIPNLDPVAGMAWLRSIPPAPPTCSAFFVTDASSTDPTEQQLQSFVGTNIQAMLVAEWLVIPTVNGFASVLPPGWNLLWTDRPDYPRRMRDYARDHGVEAALCRLDLPTRTWDANPFSAAVP